MFTSKPQLRLKSFNVGEYVLLKGYAKPMKIVKINADGYYDLANDKGRIALTVSQCHEVVNNVC